MSKVNPASFRDPSGFVFTSEGILYRQVQQSYQEHYERLIQSGLYEDLIRSKFLLPHEETDLNLALNGSAYKILRPELIPFLSYPYEWSFSQLKDAALTTLEIQKAAFLKGMMLKDASAFNFQFLQGKPVMIDTLSFEVYKQGEPWIAYRQFCQHFLAPLALMSTRDVRLNQLFRIYIDGLPLDLASGLLPFRTRFKPSLFTHIHLHARSQKRYATKIVKKDQYKISAFQLRALIDSLESAIRSLEWKAEGTEWGDYYDSTNYKEGSFEHKKTTVENYLKETNPKLLWDLGANTGIFSRLSSNRDIQTIAFDIDPVAVEKNYRQVKAKEETHLLPLILDLTNPSPSIGYENRERLSLEERGPADTVLALALLHHLAISNNVPLARVAEYFSRLCRWLVIEFVPKSDSQVQRLLATRQDIFPSYRQDAFETEFGNFFAIKDSTRINDSERTVYLMQKKKV
ncbi:SAM-dependent methyltransferase [bacterium]|nr:SAM-dependent methyltransferase [bacterium]MCI0601412.1 SAM-dependent methyltransferase [bacterium]